MSKPAFHVYIVNETETNGEKRTYWTKVGAAFSHNGQSGYNIALTPGISVSGKLVLIEPKDKDDKEPGNPLNWEE